MTTNTHLTQNYYVLRHKLSQIGWGSQRDRFHGAMVPWGPAGGPGKAPVGEPWLASALQLATCPRERALAESTTSEARLETREEYGTCLKKCCADFFMSLPFYVMDGSDNTVT